jgi:methylmalonyl-CoA mutase C-terminal domain/subunit
MKRIKVLTAKFGFDIHSRGIIVVNRALRDNGMEVVFIGNQSPEVIADTAMDEDVDIIAVGSLSSTGLEYCGKLMRLLKEKNASDIPVVFGGIIAPDEVDKITEIGVARYFPPGSDLDEMAVFFKQIGTSSR